MLKAKSKLQTFFIPDDRWFTLAPYIHYPSHYTEAEAERFTTVIAHESQHIKQQSATNKWWWLLKYFVVPSFRLSQEAEGIACELNALPESARAQVTSAYCKDLSSSAYTWAAWTEDDALEAIHEAEIRLFNKTF